MTWRERYVELVREGEAQGLTFAALGHYVSQRLTDEQLRAMLRDWHQTAPTGKAPDDQSAAQRRI